MNSAVYILHFAGQKQNILLTHWPKARQNQSRVTILWFMVWLVRNRTPPCFGQHCHEPVHVVQLLTQNLEDIGARLDFALQDVGVNALLVRVRQLFHQREAHAPPENLSASLSKNHCGQYKHELSSITHSKSMKNSLLSQNGHRGFSPSEPKRMHEFHAGAEQVGRTMVTALLLLVHQLQDSLQTTASAKCQVLPISTKHLRINSEISTSTNTRRNSQRSTDLCSFVRRRWLHVEKYFNQSGLSFDADGKKF